MPDYQSTNEPLSAYVRRTGSTESSQAWIADRIADLETGLERQRRELARLNEVLHKKNVALDALHMVWCDGGCYNGVHRYEDRPVTEELVATAERNTQRLRRWFNAARFRLDTYPTTGDWYRDRGAKLAAKTSSPVTPLGRPEARDV